MIVTDDYIRSVGKYDGKGRYYSAGNNHNYSGTEYSEFSPSQFTLDVKPVIGDYLLDCATSKGYFVLMVCSVSENRAIRHYEVLLMPANELISIVRHSINRDRPDEPSVERKVLVDRIPSSLAVERIAKAGKTCNNRTAIRYSFIIQEKYKPNIGDALICQCNRCYTVVELLPSGYEGLVQVKALL